MSLYEQFYSDINKEYMFTFIKNIIKDKLDIDISLEPSNYQYFISTFPMIFDNNNVDEIEEMNKFLLTHNVEYFSKLKVTNQDENNEPIIKDEFEKLLQEREKQDMLSESSKSSSDNVLMDVQETNTNERILEPSDWDPITVVEQKVVEQKVVEQKVVEPDILAKIINMNSSRRTNINSSRYNYKVDIDKSNCVSSDLNVVSKLVIPSCQK